ncbi:MAG: thioredoxin domain-containing protein [Xanthomonadaceae bacterium]|nr:thioredoxin domain-containing protein [Xanthomonadaceae bacterium]MDE1884859.1 thioredoxin domain-containing protein [Xanthomonadaceae bacterium]MDE1961743.1 thioredoxin domain-containing protein [Xanthomonadaceae bacterium]MDE2085071.1 thioredoxin domain-containing protein [Xanthomonadaceae bacterium]MDE2257377.1 thioredoxin domain-containing protein [Xanthomonadaceae bacterium]
MLKQVLILLAGLAFLGGCQAQGNTDAAKTPANPALVAGQDYYLITPPQTTPGDQVVVTEVFSYACPHCADFQPYAGELKSKLPKGVKFALLPAVFNAMWEPYARAFYTAQSMGLVDKTHQALFDAIHRDHEPLRTIQDLANLFYANYGASPGEFLSTATSFVIEGELAAGNQKVRDWQVDATPTLIIDGKYRVTANPERGIGFQQMVTIALQLVDQELAAKHHPAKTHK